jgi:nitrogenase molybdenum-iron protein beta chain
LQGALSTATAIRGVVPIVHSTAGCALQNYFAGNLANGVKGAGPVGGLCVSCTNVVEKHVIFGGSARLREQLKNTVKVLDGQLYLVISGCSPNLVGDDTKAMTEELDELGYPAVSVQASGFHGNAYTGYRLAVKSIIERLSRGVVHPETQKGLVNIIGIVPGQDSFWEGDLFQLSDALSKAGLIPNRLFGVDQSVENWKQIPHAEVNLVVSPWGLEIAEYLQDRFAIPYISRNDLPVGFEETARLILDVSKKTSVNVEAVKHASDEAEKAYAYFLHRFSDAYFNFNLQTGFSIIGPLSQVAGVSRFLTDTLGLFPDAIIVTDQPPVKKEDIEKLFPEIGKKTNVILTENRVEIFEILKKEKSGLILGSTLEKRVATEIGAAHLSISSPVSDRIILNRGYAGYSGGLNLLEDVGSALIAVKG